MHQAQPLTLGELYTQAQAYNPAVRAASQKLSEAEAKVKENVLASRPELLLGANGSLSRGNLPQPIETRSFYTYVGQLSLNLPSPAKSSEATKAARIALTMAQLELKKSQLDLALQLETAYYGVLQDRDAVAVAQQNLDQAKRQLDDTKKRAVAGDVPPADELKAEVPELQAQAALATTQTQYREAQQTLNSLVGEPLDQEFDLTDLATQDLAELGPAAITASDLEVQSPEVVEAKTSVDAAQAALEVAKRGNDPQLSLQASQTHTSDPSTWTNLGAVGLVLSIPLWDNGVLKQQVKEAQLEVDQANSNLAAARQTAMLTAQSDLADFKAAQTTYQLDQKIVAIAVESAQKAQQSYEAGLTTTRDVLDAQIAAAQARSDANTARYALALAAAKLKRVLGEVGF